MSKITATIIILILLTVYSCTFHRNVNDYSSPEDFYNSINSQAEKRNAYITLNNDSIYTGTYYQISMDSSFWTNTKTGIYLTQNNSEIDEVMFKHHARGMINGCLIGWTATLVLTAPLLYLSYNDTGDKAGNVAPVFIAAGIGLIGSITGAIIGYNVSDKHVYIINYSDE